MLHVADRKRFYRFFSEFFSYPEAATLAALIGQNPADLARLLPTCPAPPDPSGYSLVELETAFTAAFINRLGGVIAPPYGSVYLETDPRLVGHSTGRALEFYRSEGLALEGAGEPPDYLPTELEFLYYLVEEEQQALSRQKVADARIRLGRQKEFFLELFSPWVKVFCARILDDRESHPWYRWGAEMLKEFCTTEERWLARQ